MEFTNKIYNNTIKLIINIIKKNYNNFINEDDVSEIIYKIIKNFSQYDDLKGSYSTWVSTITKNYIIDKLKKKNIPTSIEYIYCDNFAIKNNLIDETNINYDREYLFNQLSTTLSNDELKMLQMKYIDGYNYSEIGNEFNITSSTASNKVNYLKSKIQKNKGIKNSLI